MREELGERVSDELEEVPPAEDAVVVLIEARPVPDGRVHVRCHVLLPLRQRHLKESLAHAHHLLRHLLRNTVIH